MDQLIIIGNKMLVQKTIVTIPILAILLLGTIGDNRFNEQTK